MDSAEDKAQAVFGKRAAFYSTSAAHTDPQVLARVVELANPQPSWNVLDIATGTGHTAFALSPHVASVVGIDLTPQMLEQAERLRAEKSLSNVTFKIADVHKLPFDGEAFQLVTCRRAAHHFSNIRLALREIARVLKTGGRAVIDDRSVPEDDFVDASMNLLDTYHDESHIRQYRPTEWTRMLNEAGFEVDAVEPYTRHRPLTSLTEGVSEENVLRIRQTLAALKPAQRDALNLVEKDGEIYLNHWFVMVAATRLPRSETTSAGGRF